MLRNVLRLIAALIGFGLGFQLATYSFETLMVLANFPSTPAANIGASIASGSVFGFIFYIITPWVINKTVKFSHWMDRKMLVIPTQDIVLGVVGLLIGLIIGALLSLVLYRVPLVGGYLSLGITLLLSYLGITLVTSRKDELSFITNLFVRAGKSTKGKTETAVKVLDTSVIIDGRIMDICKTGFIEGTVIIPDFILDELRHVADSSDLLKRNRGRRGLDILNKMQKELKIPIQIWEDGSAEPGEVDSKLVRLTKKLQGKMVTNDYNLNKVGILQGVPVLNINELANAVKPVAIPGEEMLVKVVKDGKESGQGVGYLEDGTMIVVENGRRFIGDTLEVVVTSVLQTAAGRMIFVRPKDSFDKVYSGVK